MRLSDLLATTAAPEEGQVETLDSLFVEEPVDLTTFVQDKKFLANPPLWPLQYEAVRAAEQIFYPELYPRMAKDFGPYWDPVPYVNLLTLLWAKGSGKDHICRIISMRVAYLLLCLRSPQSYFGMPEQDSIHLLNVASTAQQAQRAFFKPITKAVVRPGSWFVDKCNPTQNAIAWAKNVESISGHSDAESQEGLNLLVAVCDEVDAFRAADEVQYSKARGLREATNTSDAIIDMLRSSSITRFPQTFKNLYISYPRYKGSKIMQLTAEAREEIAEAEQTGEPHRHFVSGPYCTWEVRLNQTKEMYRAEYKKDPVMARAKYECDPSLTTDPYFRNDVLLDEAFEWRFQKPLDFNYILKRGKSAERVRWEPVWELSPDLVPIQGAIYAMHGDIAISGDRAGVAMAHVKSWTEETYVSMDEERGQTERTEQVPVVKVDFVAAFTADNSAEPSREVQVRWYRELVYELRRRGFPVVRYTFDGFQSTDAMQLLEGQGIETQRVSMDLNDLPWKNLRDLMYDGRLSIPWSPKVDENGAKSLLSEDLLRTELGQLTRLPNGKVDHPPKASKDLADALCGAVLGAVELGGQEAVDSSGQPLRAWADSADDVPMTLLDSGIDFMAGTELSGLPIGMDEVRSGFYQ